MLFPVRIALCLSHFLFHQTLGDKVISGANIRLEKFEQCPDKLDMPNVFIGSRATQTSLTDVSINGQIVVRQEIVEPATLKTMLYRCPSKDAPDCEYYYTYRTNEFCKFVGLKNMPWSDFWEQTTLPRSCPVKVGNYSMNGARVSLANIPDSPLLYGYWKIRSTGKSGGKTWHCAIVELSFGEEVKKRKRGKHQG